MVVFLRIQPGQVPEEPQPEGLDPFRDWQAACSVMNRLNTLSVAAKYGIKCLEVFIASVKLSVWETFAVWTSVAFLFECIKFLCFLKLFSIQCFVTGCFMCNNKNKTWKNWSVKHKRIKID